MWSIVTSLKRWFADMRRRYFGRFGTGVAPPPVPPLTIILNLTALLLLLLEDA